MQSADSGQFFETDATQAENERKSAKASNKNGDPIVMKSKILAAIADPSSPLSSIYIGESAGYVRRVNLETSETTATYRGPRAPVTCLAVGGPGHKTMFAGSWDKDIWSWDIDSGNPGRKLSGHTDFVKTIACATLSGTEVLISGGADKKILVWDLATGRRLHTLQDPTTTMLAVQHLALDPVLSTADALVVASAGSDPHIRRWRIARDAAEQLPEGYPDRPGAERPTIHEHQTSVYRLAFDADDDGDLWTASADGCAKCLERARGFVPGDELAHGDYVRAVLPAGQWVFTAGRDENVKVWDRAEGRLHAVLEGHYEEVTDLVMLRRQGGEPVRVCSVSIDRSIRTWPVARAELDEVVKRIKEADGRPEGNGTTETGEGLMTAEEEAELAELMDD